MKAKNYNEIKKLMERRELLDNLLKKIKWCISDNEAVYRNPATIQVATYNSTFEVETEHVNRDIIGEFIIGYGVVVEKEINDIDKELSKL